jgi:hypothetical protein
MLCTVTSPIAAVAVALHRTWLKIGEIAAAAAGVLRSSAYHALSWLSASSSLMNYPLVVPISAIEYELSRSAPVNKTLPGVRLYRLDGGREPHMAAVH